MRAKCVCVCVCVCVYVQDVHPVSQHVCISNCTHLDFLETVLQAMGSAAEGRPDDLGHENRRECLGTDDSRVATEAITLLVPNK